MRPIDADAIPYTMLYKENWIKGTGEEAPGAWKSDIDKMPTIETIHGYRIEHLVFIARVMAEEGVSADRLINVMEDIGLIVDMVLKEQKRLMDEEVGKWYRRANDV